MGIEYCLAEYNLEMTQFLEVHGLANRVVP